MHRTQTRFDIISKFYKATVDWALLLAAYKYVLPIMNKYLNPFARRNIGKKHGGKRMYDLKVKYIKSKYFWAVIDNYLYSVKGIKDRRKRAYLLMALVPKLQIEILKRLKHIYKSKRLNSLNNRRVA